MWSSTCCAICVVPENLYSLCCATYGVKLKWCDLRGGYAVQSMRSSHYGAIQCQTRTAIYVKQFTWRKIGCAIYGVQHTQCGLRCT
eukprot:1098766-Pyramimonas_sp.AAC.1